MGSELISLGVLALIIIWMIAGMGWLIWVLNAKSLSQDSFKRDNKGRRRGDQ